MGLADILKQLGPKRKLAHVAGNLLADIIAGPKRKRKPKKLPPIIPLRKTATSAP